MSMRKSASLWNHTDAVAPNTDDERCAGKGAVALVAHVDAGAFGVARRLAGGDEGVDARRRAAAGEEPARALRDSRASA